MEHDFIFDSKQSNRFRFLYSADAQCVIANYSWSFSVITNLLAMYLPASVLGVDLLTIDYLNDIERVKLKVSNGKKSIIVEIFGEYITLVIDNQTYCYKTDFGYEKTAYVNLVSMKEVEKDRSVLQCAQDNRKLRIEIKYDDIVYKLNVADANFVDEPFIFGAITSKSDINDLKAFCSKYFFRDRNNIDTPCREWEKSDVAIYRILNDNEVLMDKYVLDRNGLVIWYYLSARNGNMVVSKEGENPYSCDFKIQNLDFDADIKGITEKLMQRSRIINPGPRLL